MGSDYLFILRGTTSLSITVGFSRLRLPDHRFPGGAACRFDALSQIPCQSRQTVLFKPQSIRRYRTQTPEASQLSPGDAAADDQLGMEAVILYAVFQDIDILDVQPLSAMVAVLIPYISPKLELSLQIFGKIFASNINDENSAF